MPSGSGVRVSWSRVLILVGIVWPLSGHASDLDGDGVPDSHDNCSTIPSANQCDSDRDGYGNLCDGDFDQNGTVNSNDFSLYFLPDFNNSGTDSGVGSDMDCDGFVTSNDFSNYFMPQFSAQVPGPSGLGCAGSPSCGEYAYIGKTGLWDPPGPGTLESTFKMGEDSLACGAIYSPAHQVHLTVPFEMKRTEVTRAEWRSLMDPMSSPPDCPTCPVDVSWWAFAAYTNRLSADGDECYELNNCFSPVDPEAVVNVDDPEQRVPVDLRCTGEPETQPRVPALRICPSGPDGGCQEANEDTFHPKNCVGYRMPTEAEWEYAARGVYDPAFHLDTHAGNLSNCVAGTDPVLDRIAWYIGDWLAGPPYPAFYGVQPVGLKSPNQYGIYDMLGNIYEWVFDYQRPYSEATVTDPLGDTSTTIACSARTDRGGRYDYPVSNMRSAYRSIGQMCDPGFGMRVVRSVLLE